MHPIPENPRARYLTLRWRSAIAAAVGGPRLGTPGTRQDVPIAVFGGGRHTRWLLESLQLHQNGPRIAAIIADAPRAGHDAFGGIPIVRPADIDPSTGTAVIVSSDSIEDRLSAHAQTWASKAAPAARDPSVRTSPPPAPTTPRMMRCSRNSRPVSPPIPTLISPRPLKRTSAPSPPGATSLLPQQSRAPELPQVPHDFPAGPGKS
jgi:hypothetical protein